MPKTLTLIRHAKSSWDNTNLSDFERPLNSRGKHDAPKMGQLIKHELPSIDYVLCSTSQRTRETFALLNQALNIGVSQISFKNALYHPSPRIMMDLISGLPENVKHVALVSHNPATTEFANQLQEERYFDNVPTCGVIHIEFDVSSWKDLSTANGKLVEALFPKEVL